MVETKKALIKSTLLVGWCLLSAAGCMESDMTEEGISDSAQELIASFQLENGLQVEYYALDGDLLINAKAKKSNQDQVESLKDFDRAQRNGLSASELYELFADAKAPKQLVDAEFHIDALRENDVESVVESEIVEPSLETIGDSTSLKTFKNEQGLSPLMSFSNFSNTYCYKDVWSGYHSTSDRCRNSKTVGVSHTSSSSSKEGTYAVINTLTNKHVRVWHRRSSSGSMTTVLDADCPGNFICTSKSTGPSRRRGTMTVVASGAEYHAYTAILEDD